MRSQRHLRERDGIDSAGDRDIILLSPPVNTALPSILGTAQEGQTLLAVNGSWTGSPNAFAYQWIADFTPISGATASTYLLTSSEVGKAITVQVTASNAGGASTPAVSAGTTTVIAAGSVSALTITAHDYDTVTFAVPSGLTALTLDGLDVIGDVTAGSYVAPRMEGAMQDLVAAHTSGTSTAKVYEKVFVAAYLGQSNLNYALNPTTNSSGYTKPPIVTQNARFLPYNTTSLVDVTQANSLAQDINVGVANMSVWLNFVAPGKKVIFVSLAQSGTTFYELMNDSLPDRDFTPVSNAAAWLEANVAPVDLVTEWWYTGVTSQIENKLDQHLPGYIKQNNDGSPYVFGSGQFDHTLWDIAADTYETGEGVFSRGWTKWTFIPNHSKDSSLPSDTAIRAFYADSRVQTFAAPQPGTWGGHYANDDAHAIQFDPDGQVQLSWSMAIPVARALGVTIEEPEYVGFEVDPAGDWVDILVSLPNGGTLTTQRILESRGPADNPKTYQQPVSGLELERFGTGLPRMPIHKLGETVFDPIYENGPSDIAPTTFSELYRGTVTVQDTGSGSPRRGRIRFTPETGYPLVNNDKIIPQHLYNKNVYPQVHNPGTALGGTDSKPLQTNKIWLDYPIEHVPALSGSGTLLYPFPGVPVRPWGPIQTLSGITGAPYVFTPQSIVSVGTNGRAQSPLPGGTIFGSSEGTLALWFKHTDAAWPINRFLVELKNGTATILSLKTASSGRLSVGMGSGAATLFTQPATNAFTVNVWQHIIVSWKAGATNWGQISVNGGAPLTGTGLTDPNGLVITSTGFDRMGFTSDTGGAGGLAGEVGHLYLNLQTALDLTDIANRQKFINGNDPVSLGISGQLPTGSTPEFYFDGVGPAWDNLGTYGAVPVVGTLTAGSIPLLGSASG